MQHDIITINPTKLKMSGPHLPAPRLSPGHVSDDLSESLTLVAAEELLGHGPLTINLKGELGRLFHKEY